MGMPRRRNRRHGKVHRNKCWYHRKEQQDSRLIPPRSCPTDRVHLSPLLHHHPPAQKPAESHRGDTRGGCRAGTAHRPAGEGHARFPAGPIRQLRLSRLHHRPGRGDPGTGGRPPPPRRDRERHSRPQVRRRSEPHAVWPLLRQRRLAGGTGDGPQPCMIRRDATARIGLVQQIVTTKTLRRRVFALAGRLTRSARRLTLHLRRRWPWEEQFSRALARLQAIPLPA